MGGLIKLNLNFVLGGGTFPSHMSLSTLMQDVEANGICK